MSEIDVLVVGAGVVGLAVARSLAQAGLETIIAEREGQFGMGTSSRNSEVIHAGIYYPHGSLKAELCVRGKEMLYAFCKDYTVPFERCGKFIVATHAEQTIKLQSIADNALAAGMADFVWMEGAEVRRLEPDIQCTHAIFSPSTGIIDSHAYMLSLLGQAEEAGALLACNADIVAIRPDSKGWAIWLAGDDAPALVTRNLVNCGGLHADVVARAVGGMPPAAIPTLHYAKGCYFSYTGRTSFRHLIYPVPEPGGLGTHLTLDLAGQARFGPDVEWIDMIDYDVSSAKAAEFVQAIRAFWPGVDPSRLQPAYAGIRPKLHGPGEPPADFRLSTPKEHGLPGIFHLYGIESPGLTASLALAELVRSAMGI